MKYTIQSIKYILKNFLYLLPFVILPAFFLSLSVDEDAIIKVVGGAFKGDLNWSFKEIFRAVSVFNFGSWQSILFGLGGIIVIVPCVALMLALLEKHFRIGKRTFNGIWSKLNDNILSTGGYAILVLLFYELWSLLFAAMLYFFVSIIEITVIAYIFIGLLFIAFHIVLLYVIGAIYLWLPCMQITGFRAYEALHYSYQLLTPMKWKLLIVQMLSIIFVETLITLCAVFLPFTLLFTILTTTLYALLLMIYCVRMQIVYFDRDQIERADLNRFY